METLSHESIISSMTEGFIQRIRSCGAAIERYQKTLEALK